MSELKAQALNKVKLLERSERDRFIPTGTITPIRIGPKSTLFKFYYGSRHEVKWVPFSQTRKDVNGNFYVSNWYASNVLGWNVTKGEQLYL